MAGTVLVAKNRSVVLNAPQRPYPRGQVQAPSFYCGGLSCCTIYYLCESGHISFNLLKARFLICKLEIMVAPTSTRSEN